MPTSTGASVYAAATPSTRHRRPLQGDRCAERLAQSGRTPTAQRRCRPARSCRSTRPRPCAIDELHAGGASTTSSSTRTPRCKGSLDLSLTQASPTTPDACRPTPPSGRSNSPARRPAAPTRKLGPFDADGTAQGASVSSKGRRRSTIARRSTIPTRAIGSALRAARRARDDAAVSVFVEGSESYQKFDAPSPTLLTYLDGRTLRCAAGSRYKQESDPDGRSLGRPGLARLCRSARSPTQPAWVYNASVTFTPDETLKLTAHFNTSIGPSADTVGDTDVDYTLTGSARYVGQSMADAARHGQLGPHADAGQRRQSTRLSARGRRSIYPRVASTVWTADYLFSHADPALPPATDTHTVTVGADDQELASRARASSVSARNGPAIPGGRAQRRRWR